ncbi:MAG TPA: hypothetical protein VKT80_15790 [Chloroflexota bacterium]|nr:hypothetical protein [Chloroflexota bacterium]
MVHAGIRPGWRRTVDLSIRKRLHSDVLTSPIGSDRAAAILAGLSILATLGLVAYITLWLPGLPPFLPLHYNGVGSVDLLGPRTDLYKMPGIGVAVLIADLVVATAVYRRERWAALTLLGTSVLVQLILIVATINIIRLAFGD